MQLEFDRIVARLGALPPRNFLEACGIRLNGEGPGVYPAVAEDYQSLDVPGLFIIGAVGGAPLIKECLDQGYRVVETILGNEIPPAHDRLIQARLDEAGERMTAADLVERVRRTPSIFTALSPGQIGRLLTRAQLRRVSAGDTIFARREHTASLYLVLEGQIEVALDPERQGTTRYVHPGGLLGEVAAMSGRRRLATATARQRSLLVEFARDAVLRLAHAMPELGVALKRAAILREIEATLAPGIADELLADLVRTAEIVSFRPNQVMIEEGAENDPLYILRRGSVIVYRQTSGMLTSAAGRPGAGKAATVDYLVAGNWVGGTSVLAASPAPARVAAAIATEAVKLDGEALRALLDRAPELHRRLATAAVVRCAIYARARPDAAAAKRVDFMLDQRLAGAANVLFIDEALCVGCDNCETACAETHGGVSRLDRHGGPAHASLRVPTACRHCDDPSCASACPAGAIRRAPTGEVFIDPNLCVGCGDCERACNYGAISVAAAPVEKPDLLSWLLFGKGPGPGEDRSAHGIARRAGRKYPAKCDLCRDIEGGPACVTACPAGAVFRAAPDELISSLIGGTLQKDGSAASGGRI